MVSAVILVVSFVVGVIFSIIAILTVKKKKRELYSGNIAQQSVVSKERESPLRSLSQEVKSGEATIVEESSTNQPSSLQSSTGLKSQNAIVRIPIQHRGAKNTSEDIEDCTLSESTSLLTSTSKKYTSSDGNITVDGDLMKRFFILLMFLLFSCLVVGFLFNCICVKEDGNSLEIIKAVRSCSIMTLCMYIKFSQQLLSY